MLAASKATVDRWFRCRYKQKRVIQCYMLLTSMNSLLSGTHTSFCNTFERLFQGDARTAANHKSEETLALTLTLSIKANGAANGRHL
mmetsp:Transcript_18054/g.29919  ORF Transcript_18054/g.29919 Transcript_18054/m.29919 type:complete len:87 (+) Transcript_18054:204-464(+)